MIAAAVARAGASVLSAAASADAALADLRTSLPLGARTQLAGAIVAACAVTLLGVRRLPPGLPRSVAALPVFALNACLPLLFATGGELVARLAFILMSSCALLKVAALCLNRGALAIGDWSLPALTFLLIVPVYPSNSSGSSSSSGGSSSSRGGGSSSSSSSSSSGGGSASAGSDAAAGKKGRLGDSAGGVGSMLAGFTAHMSVFVACILMLAELRLPAVARYYAFALYGFISAMMTGPGALLTGLLGLEVVPPFDKPWLSTSLADYWSMRWNNSINLMLRVLIYDPIVEGRLVRPLDSDGGKAAAAAVGPLPRTSYAVRVCGLALTFAASGLLHEMMMAYVMRPYRFGWSYFFLAQIPLVLAERKFWKAIDASGVRAPVMLRRFVTQCLLVLTAHLFFFPPVERWSDTAAVIVNSCAGSIRDAAGAALSLGETLLLPLTDRAAPVAWPGGRA